MEKEKEKVVRSKKVANVANDILECRLCKRCKIGHKDYQESQLSIYE